MQRKQIKLTLKLDEKAIPNLFLSWQTFLANGFFGFILNPKAFQLRGHLGCYQSNFYPHEEVNLALQILTLKVLNYNDPNVSCHLVALLAL